ncbi:MAG: DUF2306 domain-containing protein [Hyphomonadaceae bacterium]|nr:DUF2306 domain-containing protein [Hyphomonadaceae bacterium]
MTAAKLGTSVAWGLIAFLSVGVGGYALFHVATSFQFLPLENPMFSPWGLRVHIAASGIAMILGAFQFLKALRQKAPAVHRWMGRIYIAACIVGGLAGGTIALSSTAGPIAGWGFFLLAVLWVPFTLLAWTSAMRRDFVAHERWMIRSFALTFAAVTLRLQLPAVGILDMDFLPAYRVIAWSAWVPNLIVAELWIASRRWPKRPPKQPKPASATAPA